MRALIIILLFIPLISFGQEIDNDLEEKPIGLIVPFKKEDYRDLEDYMNAVEAVKFINQARSYYNLYDLKLDGNLSRLAKKHAESFLNDNSFKYNPSFGGGQVLTVFKKREKDGNYYLWTGVKWIAGDFWTNEDDYPFYQVTCRSCKSLGFGIAEDGEKVIVISYFDLAEDRRI